MSPSDTTDTVRRLGAADAIAALDIETITTVSERELEPPNPDHQELLCTGVGYRGSLNEEIEAEVLFREDETASAELDAIEAVVNWIDAKDVDVLITFGGAWFDLPVLVGRAERAAAEIGEPGRAENVRTSSPTTMPTSRRQRIGCLGRVHLRIWLNMLDRPHRRRSGRITKLGLNRRRGARTSGRSCERKTATPV